ncbi:Rieske (2Fe-2S) protein [Lichenihabitans psoromatis]|uniref:Rieske (2Fe-2S) protein n=1 Tax=Lichenihabitans psoromatis TaxID=2528642 RepID=UPI0010365A95|nr:Rieske (2Fe-2S) protein [Lichenihabitans psoromatis]
MTPRSGWFALGLADDLERGTSTGARLFGREMVVWRDDAGRSHVWEDRCPHRGTRLSFGFVRGNYIACLYHGWQFDAAGRCRYIPAHPKLEVAATIGVERFASVERLGLIWMFLGGDPAERSPPGAVPTPRRSAACP